MICDQCGVDIPIGNWPFCPHGEVGAYAEHGDEVDFWVENMGPTPIHIRSKAEHKRLMKERGLVQAVRHVPHPEGPKSNHTVDWSCAGDEYTMNCKKELLERAFKDPIRRESERPTMIPDIRNLTPDVAGRLLEQI